MVDRPTSDGLFRQTADGDWSQDNRFIENARGREAGDHRALMVQASQPQSDRSSASEQGIESEGGEPDQATDSTSPASASYIGFCDGVRGGRVVGWALDPSRPMSVLPIACTIDGVDVGLGATGVERKDVAEAKGFANLATGFAIPIAVMPPSVAGGQEVSVEVFIDEAVRVPLGTIAAQPWEFTLSGPPRASLDPLPSGLAPTAVPQQSAAFGLGSSPLGAIPSPSAPQPNEPASSLPGLEGSHGIVYKSGRDRDLQAAVSDRRAAAGGEASLRARRDVDGPDATAAPRSPKLRGAVSRHQEETGRYEGRCEGLVDGRLVGWAFDRLQPDSRLRVVCTIDDAVVARGQAGLTRDDVAAAGHASRACGFSILLIVPASLVGDHRHLSVTVCVEGDAQAVIGTVRVRTADLVVAGSASAQLALLAPDLGEPSDDEEPEDEAETIVGYVDEVTRNYVLSGWAARQGGSSVPLFVSCYAGGERLASSLANLDRPDVARAGFRNARCGFEIDLSSLIKPSADGRLPEVTVFAEDDEVPVEIGRWEPGWTMQFGVSRISESTRERLAPICLEIVARSEAERKTRDIEMPYFGAGYDGLGKSRDLGPKYEALFDSSRIPATVRMATGARTGAVSGYGDYVRYRYKVDGHFQVGLTSASADAYLRWYIETYSRVRTWRRPPLSSSEIAYLNGSASATAPSRAMSFFLSDRSNQRIASEAERIEVSYRWAVEIAPSLYVEDCLVPQWCIDTLSFINTPWRKVHFPLSRYMEIIFSKTTSLHFLDLNLEQDRALFYCYMLCHGLLRPDLLRYVPKRPLFKLIDTTVAVEGGETRGFDDFLSETLGLGRQSFSLARLREECASRMFDFDRSKFATLTVEGHRIAATALPMPIQERKVDVQIIGPFQKASGLGQATRMSADLLVAAGCSISTFDFGIDNPAPEGFSTKVKTESLQNAAINIIHLNAESIPLAYAYMPPIFRESYNIGFFYWELDSPANCHYLALDLLDEIWVSTDYCRDIYSKATTKPVINVGMAVEQMSSIDKGGARAFVEERLGYSDRNFVFLAAFDSFSFVQRKNPIAVVRAFRTAFPDNPDVRLLLKTHNRESVDDHHQQLIWDAIQEEAAADSRITIMNETLSYDEIRLLKAGVDCYVSLHRSEGWGFGMIEAMCSRTPVVATAYSGNMDFCRPDTSWLVDFEEVFLGPADYIFVVPGQKWAEPSLQSAVSQMRAVYDDPYERSRRATAAESYISESFSIPAISTRFKNRIHEILS